MSATLRNTIDSSAPLRPAQAIGIALEVLDALAALHRANRVHGEVAPERISVRDGHVEVLPPLGHLDPRYAAPEVQGGAIGADARGDVFAVGVILYELLTRTLPGAGAPRPSSRTPSLLGARLEAAVMRAIDPAPDARFVDAAELLHELRVCLFDALGVAARGRDT